MIYHLHDPRHDAFERNSRLRPWQFRHDRSPLLHLVIACVVAVVVGMVAWCV